MHLVGFTIEIYYDAQPYERQTKQLLLFTRKHNTESRKTLVNAAIRTSNLTHWTEPYWHQNTEDLWKGNAYSYYNF